MAAGSGAVNMIYDGPHIQDRILLLPNNPSRRLNYLQGLKASATHALIDESPHLQQQGLKASEAGPNPEVHFLPGIDRRRFPFIGGHQAIQAGLQLPCMHEEFLWADCSHCSCRWGNFGQADACSENMMSLKWQPRG